MAGSAGGAFTGLYQGSSGAADASAALKPLLPGISVYQQGGTSAPQLQNQVTTPAPTTPSGSGGFLSNFEHFLGGLASETGHLAAGAASWLGHNALQLAEAPVKLGQGIGHGIVDRQTIDSINQQTQQISGRMTQLAQLYKSGKISSTQYKLGLKDIGLEASNLDKQSSAMVNKTTLDQKASTSALIDTATGLLTILTAGGTTAIRAGASGIALEPVAAKTAADWLASEVARPILEPVAGTINRLATDSRAFQALDHITQNVLQRATAEVVANSGATMTAGQIARATAANVVLKYPIYFNYMSSTAHQVYQELDQKKYGDAVRTLAFNGALLLSGGPIGQALKYGGKALSGVTERTFGQTSFWDELGKLRGDTSIYTREISAKAQQLEGTARQEYIKNWSAVEAYNVHATGGDAVAAAARFAKGQQLYHLGQWTDVPVAQELEEMAAHAKAFRSINDAALKAGIGPIAIGRFDVRNKSLIAKVNNLDEWQALKATYPNDALANNVSLDRQVTEALANLGGGTPEFKQYIMNIKAKQIVDEVDKLPKDVLEAAAKEGYIPIRPHNLEAPFKEGTGKLLTANAEGEDFFTKAVQPLPVLGQVGALFTKLGLSPQASQERVYQYFTDNVTRNLERTQTAKIIETRLAKKQAEKEALKAANKPTVKVAEAAPAGLTQDEMKLLEKQGITPATHPDIFQKAEVKGELQAGAGATEKPAETALPSKQISATDYMIKRLSNYAKEQKLPVQDMRMLTNKDVRTALKVSRAQAEEIQNAIAQAHIQVPLAVRGMGDRAVDWTYNLPGISTIQRRYLRLQGALRFSFNPFFQYLRLIPKTEILTEAEGGGAFRSVFQGRMPVISEIRAGLRESGLFDEVGKGGVFGNVQSGEATAFSGGVRNLNKHLLPAQEVSIAGLIDAQAQRMGMSWQDFVKQFPHETADTIQRIAEYDRNSSFLNSPLARTLNIAIFPFRFDVKVATIMGKSLARSSLLTQVAFINGLMKAHAWLNSPEGQAWYSKNSEAIGIFSYITPFMRMNEVMESLLPGKDHHLGNFGELGGLPFGWIPQILDSEGLTHFNQPGASAKTGEAYPQYIPATAKGQAAIAIQDFLNSLFSYPGATAGLPSKNKIAQTVAFGVLNANKTKDFTKTIPTLSADQQQYQKNLQSQNPQQQQTPINYQSQPSGTMEVKPTSTKVNVAAKVKAKKAKTARLKKSDFPVMLPPGQTQAGVL